MCLCGLSSSVPSLVRLPTALFFLRLCCFFVAVVAVLPPAHLRSAVSFTGVAPPSFVAINAGTTLYKLTTAGEAVSWNSLAVLGVLAVLSILPVCFKKKLE